MPDHSAQFNLSILSAPLPPGIRPRIDTRWRERGGCRCNGRDQVRVYYELRSVLEMLVLVLLPRKFVKILFFFFLFNSLELDKTMR